MLGRLPAWLRQHVAALRALLVLTLVLGVAYPLAITGVGQLPGLRPGADGSLLRVHGTVVGSRLIGQSFTTDQGRPLLRYFQSRPSAAGNGYDPTASGASNLGPEQVVDVLPDPAKPGDHGRPSLLSQVCARSKAVGDLEGVNGQRPYCTADGVGAVLAVFRTGGFSGKITRVVSLNQACPAAPFLPSWQGVPVQCAQPGQDYSAGVVTPVRGAGRPWPGNPVPPDAVTASGSGLDPHISVQYARLQAPRVARERGLPLLQVRRMIDEYTTGSALGFLGEPAVNVLQLNLALNALPGQRA